MHDGVEIIEVHSNAPSKGLCDGNAQLGEYCDWFPTNWCAENLFCHDSNRCFIKAKDTYEKCGDDIFVVCVGVSLVYDYDSTVGHSHCLRMEHECINGICYPPAEWWQIC